MRLQEANRDLATALKSVKTGDSVILTEDGVPFAVVEPLREASEAEQEAIQELIDEGVLQAGKKTGSVREWKWKSTRSKVA